MASPSHHDPDASIKEHDAQQLCPTTQESEQPAPRDVPPSDSVPQPRESSKDQFSFEYGEDEQRFSVQPSASPQGRFSFEYGDEQQRFSVSASSAPQSHATAHHSGGPAIQEGDRPSDNHSTAEYSDNLEFPELVHEMVAREANLQSAVSSGAVPERTCEGETREGHASDSGSNANPDIDTTRLPESSRNPKNSLTGPDQISGEGEASSRKSSKTLNPAEVPAATTTEQADKKSGMVSIWGDPNKPLNLTKVPAAALPGTVSIWGNPKGGLKSKDSAPQPTNTASSDTDVWRDFDGDYSSTTLPQRSLSEASAQPGVEIPRPRPSATQPLPRPPGVYFAETSAMYQLQPAREPQPIAAPQPFEDDPAESTSATLVGSSEVANPSSEEMLCCSTKCLREM
jgi:hypothetical protein